MGSCCWWFFDPFGALIYDR
uniref:Uncharacterized protein n=1 Tax=Arundo donax TaxID=35708 RepID=A0A0A9HK31_ARUDO